MEAVARPLQEWREHFDGLVAAGRASEAHVPGGGGVLWVASERRPEVQELWSEVRLVPDSPLPAALTAAGFKVKITGNGHRVTSYGPNGPQPAGSTITINLGFPF